MVELVTLIVPAAANILLVFTCKIMWKMEPINNRTLGGHAAGGPGVEVVAAGLRGPESETDHAQLATLAPGAGNRSLPPSEESNQFQQIVTQGVRLFFTKLSPLHFH